LADAADLAVAFFDGEKGFDLMKEGEGATDGVVPASEVPHIDADNGSFVALGVSGAGPFRERDCHDYLLSFKSTGSGATT
jgi:hypothetical protein